MIATLATAAAVALGACGGDDGDDEPAGGATAPATQPRGSGTDDEAAIRETMITYIRAVADGDGAAACAQLTENGKRIAASAPGATADDCEGVIDEIGAAFKPSDRAKLGALKPEDVEVQLSAGTATATFRGAQTAKLVRRGDRWLIDAYSTRAGEQPEPEEDPAADVKSVPFDRAEEKLKEALDKRYDSYRYECPSTDPQMDVGEKRECEATGDGEKGTATLELKENAYLQIRLDIGGRMAFSQSQVRP